MLEGKGRILGYYAGHSPRVIVLLPHPQVRVAPSKNKLLTNILPMQTSPDSSKPSIPPPLNIPPSRARRQLAARLAKKKAEAADNGDPDAADRAALETASAMPENPSETSVDLAPKLENDMQESGLQITGLQSLGGLGSMGSTASRVSQMFDGSDDSSNSEGEMGYDEDDAGRDVTLNRAEGEFEDVDVTGSPSFAARGQRQSTTEAKQRTPLDDGDDEAADLGRALDAKLELGAGNSSSSSLEVHDDSSDDDELVEIRPRRTS